MHKIRYQDYSIKTAKLEKFTSGQNIQESLLDAAHISVSLRSTTVIVSVPWAGPRLLSCPARVHRNSSTRSADVTADNHNRHCVLSSPFSLKRTIHKPIPLEGLDMSAPNNEVAHAESSSRAPHQINREAGDDIYMRRMQAGEYLRSNYGFCSPSLLSKLATVGGGPLYSRMGRLNLYRKSDLDSWALTKIGPSRRSTSDTPSTISSK